jgi:hypothetical protein
MPDNLTSVPGTALSETQAAATLTAHPTITFTPTQTRETTPTNTPPPKEVVCRTKIRFQDRIMYPFPGGGVKRGAVVIPTTSEIDVIGRIEDQGWFKVRYLDQEGWMRSDKFELPDDCRPTQYDISHLLGLVGPEYDLLFEDAFVGNKGRWVINRENSIFPELTYYGEDQLIYESSEDQTTLLTSENPAMASLEDFRFIVAFYRVIHEAENSWFGLRFRESENGYYSITLNPFCELSIYATNEVAFRRELVFQRDVHKSICSESLFLVDIELRGYDLVIRINDSDPINILLDDPSDLFSSGTVGVEVYNSRIEVDYIIVLKPK